MFTGIVEELGRLQSRDGNRFVFDAQVVIEDMKIGDSIAHNGCCLTVVEIGPGMIRGDAGAKTNLVLRDGRVIDWSDPEPAMPQLMAEAIHSFAIADHDRHDVGGRIARIQSERVELLVEIIGVFPETLA